MHFTGTTKCNNFTRLNQLKVKGETQLMRKTTYRIVGQIGVAVVTVIPATQIESRKNEDRGFMKTEI